MRSIPFLTSRLFQYGHDRHALISSARHYAFYAFHYDCGCSGFSDSLCQSVFIETSQKGIRRVYDARHEKGRISRLFAGETLCVGIIALGTGLLLGFFFSQGFSLIALRLFAINLEKFRIVFSAGALRQTVLCFTIIFLSSCFSIFGLSPMLN